MDIQEERGIGTFGRMRSETASRWRVWIKEEGGTGTFGRLRSETASRWRVWIKEEGGTGTFGRMRSETASRWRVWIKEWHVGREGGRDRYVWRNKNIRTETSHYRRLDVECGERGVAKYSLESKEKGK